MIPRILERAILNGWADFRTISHAFGTFGAIPIPDNSTVIITHVKWFPFINPIPPRVLPEKPFAGRITRDSENNPISISLDFLDPAQNFTGGLSGFSPFFTFDGFTSLGNAISGSLDDGAGTITGTISSSPARTFSGLFAAGTGKFITGFVAAVTVPITWRDFFKYNEYQLKIDGNKSINYLQFRNEFDYKIFGAAQSGTISLSYGGTVSGNIAGSITGTEDINLNGNIVGAETIALNGDITGNIDPVSGDVAEVIDLNGTVPINESVSLNGSANINEAAALSISQFEKGVINGTITLGEAFNLDDPIDYTFLINKVLPTQKAPIQQDVYFVCERFIKLSVTRNVYNYQMAANNGLLANVADEYIAPSGLKDTTLLLKNVMTSPGGNQMVYYAPGYDNSGVFTQTNRNTEGYRQDYDKDFSGIGDVSTPDSFTSKFPYQTSPLVELGIVIINNKHFDQIKNS